MKYMFIDEFEVRNTKQQLIINDQQKVIQKLEEENNNMKIFYEKQIKILSEQVAREKADIKAVCISA